MIHIYIYDYDYIHIHIVYYNHIIIMYMNGTIIIHGVPFMFWRLSFVFFGICLPDVQTWRGQDPSTDWIFWQPMIFPVNLGFQQYRVFALLSAGS